MTDEKETTAPPRSGLNKDEVALELTRFISATTGYGKTGTTAGFAGKPAKSPEEQVDALLNLFERCKAAVGK